MRRVGVENSLVQYFILIENISFQTTENKQINEYIPLNSWRQTSRASSSFYQKM